MYANKKIPGPKYPWPKPWLLCQSKRFPGKNFYFNTSTGESTWCLSETDENARNGTIHGVTGRTHNYSEPFRPAIDNHHYTHQPPPTPVGTNMTNFFTSLNNMGNPIFSHANERPGFVPVMFPRNVNFLWVLRPMFMPSQLPDRQHQMMQTQTGQRVLGPLHSNYFQQSFVPSYPSFQLQNQPFQFQGTETSNKGTQVAKQVQTKQMKDEACQTLQAPKSILKKGRSVYDSPTLTKFKVDNDICKLSGLDNNDLRLKLVAKRRNMKSTVGSERVEKPTDQSTMKTRGAQTPKKHVIFDVQESDASLGRCDDNRKETDQVRDNETAVEAQNDCDKWKTDKPTNFTRPNKVNTVFSSQVTNLTTQASELCISENKQIIRKDLDKKTDQDTINVKIEKNVTQKIRDAIKESGITKLNNNFNLDVYLEKFHVKNTVVENRIMSRLEEWMCRLNQTTEGVLTEILLKEKNKIKTMMPPWNLFEAIQVTGQSFKKQPYIKTITDYFSMKLLNFSSDIEKLNKDIKPNDFMNLVGLSMILIEHLKKFKNCKELYEADEMLVDLIKNIEDPETDIDLSLEIFHTPTFSTSEISVVEEPTEFKKSRADIVEYLEKHYAAWQSSEVATQIEAAKEKTIKESATIDDNILDKESNVIRTSGKELNTLKLNNTKTIKVENTTATPHFENQPKVIRNVKITQGAEAVPAASSGDNEVNNLSDGNDKITNTPNHILHDLADSATSAECAKALPAVKRFLVNLKNSLLKLVEFTKGSIQEFKDGISVDRKADILKTTKQAQQYLRNISEGLKSIIARESSEKKILKRLLVKAGDYEYVENHPILSNYTQTVAMFLEETQLLENALEHLLSLCNAASVKEKKERTSPRLPTRRLSKRRFQ